MVTTSAVIGSLSSPSPARGGGAIGGRPTWSGAQVCWSLAREVNIGRICASDADRDLEMFTPLIQASTTELSKTVLSRYSPSRGCNAFALRYIRPLDRPPPTTGHNLDSSRTLPLRRALRSDSFTFPLTMLYDDLSIDSGSHSFPSHPMFSLSVSMYYLSMYSSHWLRRTRPLRLSCASQL